LDELSLFLFEMCGGNGGAAMGVVLDQKRTKNTGVNDFAATLGCRGGETKLEGAPAAYPDKISYQEY
jgi:hypothetical protein